MGRRVEYRGFEEAREFARALSLRSKEEWTLFSKGELPGKPAKPGDIPARVDKIYKGKGWSGFDDFLGTKRSKELRKSFRTYEYARSHVRRLKLLHQQDWESYLRGEKPHLAKLPPEIPTDPEAVYSGKGWVSWADFLQDRYTPTVVEQRDFHSARSFSHALKLRSIQEWERFRNGEMPEKGPCPEDIPVWPPHTYKDKGWMNWADWLGLHIGLKEKS